MTPDGAKVSMKVFSGKTGQIDLTTSFDAKAVLLSAIIPLEGRKELVRRGLHQR